MVKINFFPSALCLLFAYHAVVVAQTEGGVSMIQAWQANADSYANYDVSYRHWIGFMDPAEKVKGTDSDMTESVTQGRIVVDRSKGRIAFARYVKLEVNGNLNRRFDYYDWQNDVERSMSDREPIPRTSRRTFEQFCKARFVPIVECTLVDFPETLATRDLQEDSVATIGYWADSSIAFHPDGSSTIATHRPRENRIQTRMLIDPSSTMPTKISSDECDPKSGAFLRTIHSGNPRYEKCKEVYRIISHEYNDRMVIREQPRETVGTVQFTWHQFNEDAIRFPCEAGVPFELEDAKEFLRQGIGEESK